MFFLIPITFSKIFWFFTINFTNCASLREKQCIISLRTFLIYKHGKDITSLPMEDWEWWILWWLHRISGSHKNRQQSTGQIPWPFQYSTLLLVPQIVLAFSYPFVMAKPAIFPQKRTQLCRNYQIKIARYGLANLTYEQRQAKQKTTY